MILSDKSSVPIGWMFTFISVSAICVSVALGIGLYVSKIEYKADNTELRTIVNEAEIKKTREDFGNKLDEIKDLLINLDKRISRIE